MLIFASFIGRETERNVVKHFSQILFLLLLFITPLIKADDKVIITVPDEDVPFIEVAEIVMTDLYHRLGLEINMLRLPAKRAIWTANNGDALGELIRIDKIIDQYPNMVKIPIPIGTIKFSVFSKDHQFTVTGWDSLKPYKIGLLRGTLFSKSVPKNTRTIKTNSLEDLFRMLETGRVDVVIYHKMDSLYILKELGLDKTIHMLTPDLQEVNMYHYIHKSNESHISRLTALMLKMQDDGSLQELLMNAHKMVKHIK